MNRALFRFVIVVLALAFGIFYGIDLAQKGIEQVHGPLAQAQQADTPATSGGTASGEAGGGGGAADGEAQDGGKTSGEPEVIDYRDQPAPDRSSEGAAAGVGGSGKDSSTLGALFRHAGAAIHYLADGILRFIVKIGESVLD